MGNKHIHDGYVHIVIRYSGGGGKSRHTNSVTAQEVIPPHKILSAYTELLRELADKLVSRLKDGSRKVAVVVARERGADERFDGAALERLRSNVPFPWRIIICIPG
jgi:hypothetical protein